MPLPREEALRPSPTPPPPQSFTSCPPEDVREPGANNLSQFSATTSLPAEAGSSGDRSILSDASSMDEGASPETLPETDSESSSPETTQTSEGSDIGDKDANGQGQPSDFSISAVASSNTSSETEINSTKPTTLSNFNQQPPPLYLHFPRVGRERYRPVATTTSFLKPGSKFEGTQKSDSRIYNVQVELKHVDMSESFLCGYLRIQGLTDEHPSLTTFFKGEIIGPKYLFKTTNPSWGSSEKVDQQHWNRFPAWRQQAKAARSPNFSMKDLEQHEHLFMRWKEEFLVPDHRVKTISGASFEGFYYIDFNQCSGSVSGIYFHAKSEKYQQLDLEHVRDNGCAAAMEFR